MGPIPEELIVLNEENKKYLNNINQQSFRWEGIFYYLLAFDIMSKSLCYIFNIYTLTLHICIYIYICSSQTRACNINVCVCRYLVCVPSIFIFLPCYLCIVRHAFSVRFCKSSALFIATEYTKNLCRTRKIFLNLLGKKIQLLGYFLAYKRGIAYVLFVT